MGVLDRSVDLKLDGSDLPVYTAEQLPVLFRSISKQMLPATWSLVGVLTFRWMEGFEAGGGR